MQKILPYISALGIILFFYFLLPTGQDQLKDLGEDLTDKKDSVVDQYETAKETVNGFTDQVTDTQQKLEQAVDTVNQTKQQVDELNQKMKQFMKAQEAEQGGDEPWRQSDPKLDPSIEAGRVNYNYANPGEEGLSKAHLELDIKPWIEWGSSEEDETTKEKRIEILSQTEYGRAMLEKLGYDY